ncbi:carbohydrate ABC transporter permease [Phyllobacterium myrsinacearum]|uniref:Multiple sugar transport system permease protein n=1 Tax=Phyllobacterium myrsinacearum TaxID=28101 RepID=A0A839EUJ1_9HYPH|nr:sugar ABC transporter permease [Phyllobacterium myrsinacearum]MBA8880996.1 multiple sugar transport system permease protein [Phyllobacterium myrsinacearum]
MSVTVTSAAKAPLSERLNNQLAGYGFLLPWLIGFFVLTLGPAVSSLYFSLTDFSLMGSPNWVGTENYFRIATDDPRFWTAMNVTFTFVLLSVPLKLMFALAVAVALDKGLRGLNWFRAIFYLPSLIGGSVAIAVLWRQIFAGDGVLNQVLAALFGYEGPSWISNPSTALYTLVMLAVWQFGSSMIIFLAGLRQIPQDMYEAASIDGASRQRQFFKITLPLLTPVIFFNGVILTIEAFKAFTAAFVISDGSGGPIDSTLFYTLYLYQEAFTNFRFGYASALAWVLVVIIAIFTALSFISAKYWVHYDD